LPDDLGQHHIHYRGDLAAVGETLQRQVMRRPRHTQRGRNSPATSKYSMMPP
jgi:hypothetical protein